MDEGPENITGQDDTVLGRRAYMEPKPGYSELVPNFYQATVEKITTVPAESGGQNYKVLLTIPRNSATRDLGDFVGQPVMVAIKSVQLPLPVQPAKPKVDTATGEVLEPKRSFFHPDVADLVTAANVAGYQEEEANDG